MKKIIFFLRINTILAILLIAFQSFAAIHIITVQNFSFSPSSISDVNIGDTVRWVWVSGSHTTTSTTIPAGTTAWDHQINSGSSSFDYIPAVSGNYNYKCTPHQSMGMIGSFTVLAPSGIAESWKSISVKIFPNPFYDHVSFQFNSDHSYLRNLKIFDLTGKLSKDLYFPGNPKQTIFSLNLTDIPTGVYLFEFIDNLNNLSTKRVIRQ